MRLRPHTPLFLIGVLLFGAAFLVDVQQVDIHVHDTYYIIGWSEYYFVLSFLLLLVGLLYWTFRRYFYNRFLTWLHVIMFLASVTALAILPFYSGFMDLSAYPLTFPNQTWVFVALAALVFGNVLFLYNIVAGFLRAQRIKRKLAR